MFDDLFCADLSNLFGHNDDRYNRSPRMWTYVTFERPTMSETKDEERQGKTTSGGIERDSKSLTLRLNLPGVEPADVFLQTVDGVITVSWKDEKQQQRSRSWNVIDSFECSAASAELRLGVLTIMIPRKQEKTPKKIDVVIK